MLNGIRPDWEKVFSFIANEAKRAEMTIDYFLSQNNNWDAKVIIEERATYFLIMFWLKPRKTKRHETGSKGILRASYIKPKEAQDIGKLIARIIEEKNLKAWFNNGLKEGLLSYKIRVKNYSSFKKNPSA
ncbi:MAG: hypothetical protein PHN37_01640 [Candidatus Pacebacteria bacterium]|nr:hypothetical protein [Candidatus Paceibacterota bacterium]